MKLNERAAVNMVLALAEKKIAAIREERNRLLTRSSELERELEDIDRARKLIAEADSAHASSEQADDGFDRIAMGC